MRLRIRRRYQILLVLAAIAAMWLFSIWPFGGSEPLSCAEPGRQSPFRQVISCAGTLADAYSEMKSAVCKKQEDGKVKCDVPDDNAAGSFSILGAFLDETPLARAVPSLFRVPATLDLAPQQSLIIDWPADANDNRVLIGQVALGAKSSGKVQVTYKVGKESREHTLEKAGARLRIGLVAASGGTLTMKCLAEPCRFTLSDPVSRPARQ